MGLIRTGNPAAEPVTLAEAKAHLRVDSSDEDALIAAMISAAREAAEHETGRTFVSTPWRLTLDQFPTSIALPMPRVTAVTQIHYVDGDGITQALNPAGYQLIADSEYEAWIEPAYGYSWPQSRRGCSWLSETCTPTERPAQTSRPCRTGLSLACSIPIGCGAYESRQAGPARHH